MPLEDPGGSVSADSVLFITIRTESTSLANRLHRIQQKHSAQPSELAERCRVSQSPQSQLKAWYRNCLQVMVAYCLSQTGTLLTVGILGQRSSDDHPLCGIVFEQDSHYVVCGRPYPNMESTT